MGKSTNGQQSNKSIIAKEKLSDDDFDKLVIDTSHQVIQKSSINIQSSNSKVVQQRSLADDDCGKSNDHNRLNQPKRPMNAFMVWGQAIRRELHDKFSNVQNALLSKALGRVWRSLDPLEKEPFVKKANLIKANHKRDFPNYRYRPRRIQERRAKCNMLIGIHLNHPINQNPRPSNFVMDHTVTGQNFIQTSRDVRRDNQQVLPKQRSVNLDRNFSYGLEEFDETTKQAEGVRTYEYPPYPVAQRTENNRNHPVLDCRNYLAGIGCHNEGFHELHQQTAIASKQSTESSYPLYRQFAYSVQQQHHQQQQYQPLPYEVSQQVGYFEVRESPTVNNASNYYTTMNTTANQPTHTHHQVFTHPDIRESNFKCSSNAI